ncbi:MAG: zinc-ribbon domain containing protein [Chloroflexi bacterium]|nr:zinc-ribbon domain containing protein [Chloroflexota bacterium]MDA1271975.1 zinc-ribbon domain containing protein [Chloroflexota bacterium]
MLLDGTFKCVECSSPFTFNVGEERFFASKPRRCPECRGLGGSPQAMYPAVCAECGKEAILPFRLRSDRPAYCSDCFFKGTKTDSAVTTGNC